jgi:hypothetical protein
MAKWVYGFGGGTAEGSAAMKDLLGGKGANLAEMASLGLPVPPGFTISTEVCTFFYGNGRTYPPDLRDQVETALDAVAGRNRQALSATRPIPSWYRYAHGARASMPGMMDTVLNLGLTDATVPALGASCGPAASPGTPTAASSDVRKRGARRRPRGVRWRVLGTGAGTPRGRRGHRIERGRIGQGVVAATRPWSKTSSASPFAPGPPMTNFGARIGAVFGRV